ncbi:hypothetical protein [Salmonirosea aquatica]|uniref:Uncharacterized protein n=1 Tax=Salmonirosea aquatica TaxID=2654236 RepID=A0A7C9FMU7_9BACT|nr:hypothetical protein [Cytophagaceae bacterium SJW1-29]
MEQVKNPINEAIRLLDFVSSDDRLYSLAGEFMETGYTSGFSSEKEQEMIRQLNASLRNTLGSVIREAVEAKSLTISQASQKSLVPEKILNGLLADSVAVTNVPVVLFRKLLHLLDVPLSKAKEAVLYNTHIFRTQLSLSVEAPSLAFKRKSGRDPFDLSEGKSEGINLFENEEAVKLYLNRLEEIWGN